MARLWRRYRLAVLAVAVVLGLGTASSSAGGQAPDERDAQIARLQALVDDQQTLIVAQESLLNDYRCLFDIDTQLVPNGCPEQTQPAPTATASPTPTPTPTATASPTPTPTPTATPTTLPDPTIPAGTTQAQWDHLIQCESGGNYRAYNPAGPYLGAFQFLQGTWNGVAKRHYPHLDGVDPRDAAPADQHRMAYALYEERGWPPWPACTAAFRQ